MKALDALNILNDLSASQQGFFTSAQAKSAGIDRLVLSRLESHAQVERVMHGVYRSCAAPSFREEDVWAAWLALEPAVPAWNRSYDGTQGVASHCTASWLLEIGELNPTPITFTMSVRKQTRRSELRLVKANIAACEVMLVAGIPVTKPSRTILDLLKDGEDLSLIAHVFKDATAIDKDILSGEFAAKIDAYNVQYGLLRSDSLYERIADR